jgi:hypothetical protein
MRRSQDRRIFLECGRASLWEFNNQRGRRLRTCSWCGLHALGARPSGHFSVRHCTRASRCPVAWQTRKAGNLLSARTANPPRSETWHSYRQEFRQSGRRKNAGRPRVEVSRRRLGERMPSGQTRARPTRAVRHSHALCVVFSPRVAKPGGIPLILRNFRGGTRIAKFCLESS